MSQSSLPGGSAAGDDIEFRRGFVADLFRMDGKVALLTGGHGAIAEAIASTLADLGCKVALAARKQEQCATTAQQLQTRFGSESAAFRCDVSREAEVTGLIERVWERFGRIDVLINSAGTSWWGLPEEIPLSGWQKVMDVNVTGTFLCSREVARRMIATGIPGSIINVASVGAYLSYRPQAGQVVPYTTSKAAVVHLTRDLAAQWAEHQIRVNAIAPGSFRSGMTETLQEPIQDELAKRILMNRLGRPSELAGVLATLASGAGSFITGQTFLVDGGQAIG
jgi:gluconate 5-dehydrogenase